jgi:hypothetical protein
MRQITKTYIADADVVRAHFGIHIVLIRPLEILYRDLKVLRLNLRCSVVEILIGGSGNITGQTRWRCQAKRKCGEKKQAQSLIAALPIDRHCQKGLD